jgi:hypothetical protein
MTAQRGKPLSRRAGRREQRDRFLIYAEGDVSETIYLKGVLPQGRAQRPWP